MRARVVLAAEARRLNREAGAPPIPSLYFLTDPVRTPDPMGAIARLPRGAAVIYRHFGAPERVRVAKQLARVCRRRGLVLLIAADPDLARRVRAAGVHWPETRAPERRTSAGLVTMAAHSLEALRRAAAFGADAALLSPIFPTKSNSDHPTLGPFRASQWARAAGLPVIALGGVTPRRARTLAGRGFAGIAAIEALLD